MSIKPATFVSIETSAFSGATLLAFLMGSHPAIATVGEMSGLIARDNPDEYLCSCGQKIKVCDFWQLVTTAMGNKGFEFDVANFDTRFTPNGSQLFKQIREGSLRNNLLDSIRDAVLFALPGQVRQIKTVTGRNVAFVEAVLEITGKQVFVDSSKNRLRLKALRHFSTFNIRAIHLVRDVRGVVASKLRRDTQTEVTELAKQWTKLHRRVETTLGMWPQDNYMQVRYEDLCQNTKQTMQQVYEFCGVDPPLKLEDLPQTSFHIIGNPMRLQPVSEIKLDERWKRELTTTQLQAIERIAGPLSQRYGYL